jgi:uncharacterized protein YjaG (DUF416 family)
LAYFLNTDLMDHFAAEASAQVPTLTTSAKAAFAYAICERLTPHYHAFSEAEGWGDLLVLQSALVVLRQAVFAAPAIPDVQRTYRQVEEVTPDSDDFGSSLGSFALDTCCAILAALDFILTAHDQAVLDVATFARNTVDLYVQELEELDPNDPHLEQKIDRSLSMVQEVQWQRAALKRLASREQPSPELLQELLPGPTLDLALLPE